MFKHALVRDVVYASLLKASRQQLHRAIGEALRQQLPERAEAEPEVVAHHFANAGLRDAAVEWWSKAGDLALQRSAHVEAVAHLEKALDLSQLGDSPQQRLQRLRLQIIYGNALRTVRGFAAAETKAAFARARELAGTVADVPERFSADYGLWSANFLSGDLSAMRDLSQAFLRNAEGPPELQEIGIAHRICGMTSWFAGDFIDAREHLEPALAHYDGERDHLLAFRFGQDLAVPVMAYLALTLWPLGIGEAARRFLDRAITHAIGTKHVPTVAYALIHASMFEMIRRDWLRSRPLVQGYLDLAREHVMPMWLAYGTFHEGWLHSCGGDHRAGAAQMREGLHLMREESMLVFMPVHGVVLAETEAAAGQHDAAVEAIDAALAMMIQSGQCWFLSEAHRVRGELLLKSNPADTGAAEAAFAQAIEVARSQSATRFELRAAMRLARLLRDQGKRAEHDGLLSVLAERLADGSDFDGFSEVPVQPGWQPEPD